MVSRFAEQTGHAVEDVRCYTLFHVVRLLRQTVRSVRWWKKLATMYQTA
jgi:hypothetical protein